MCVEIEVMDFESGRALRTSFVFENVEISNRVRIECVNVFISLIFEIVV